MNLSYRQGTEYDLPGIQKLAIRSWAPFQNQLTTENWHSLKQTISHLKTYETLFNQSTCFVCIADNVNIVGMAFIVPNGNPTDIYLKE